MGDPLRALAVAGDPAPRVQAAYRAAAPRMAGIAIVNPRLRVEALGFRRWRGQWLGALVTPWCLNVLLLPDDPAAWPAVAAGDTRRVRLPAGTYDFVAARDQDLGEHHDLSLFSPVLEFEDALAARLTALAALDALLDPRHDEVRERPGVHAPAADEGERRALAGALEPERAASGPLAAIRAAATAPLGRRQFLRGDFVSALGTPRSPGGSRDGS